MVNNVEFVIVLVNGNVVKVISIVVNKGYKIFLY